MSASPITLPVLEQRVHLPRSTIRAPLGLPSKDSKPIPGRENHGEATSTQQVNDDRECANRNRAWEGANWLTPRMTELCGRGLTDLILVYNHICILSLLRSARHSQAAVCTPYTTAYSAGLSKQLIIWRQDIFWPMTGQLRKSAELGNMELNVY